MSSNGSTASGSAGIGLLAGKRILVTGIATPDSIAFHVARRAQTLGATVAVSAHPREVERATEVVAALPAPVGAVIAADATDAGDLAALTAELHARFGGLDGALHAIAFSPKDALADLRSASAPSVELAFRTSVFSYVALGSVLAELAPADGASLVGLDFMASRAWPVYNWMGVCKAALGSANRYLARDLGAQAIRTNLVAAGPLHTRAAGGIPGFDQLLRAWETHAPMAWDPTDAEPVADAVCYLLSDLSRAVTGEIHNVDAGYHAIAAPLRPATV